MGGPEQAEKAAEISSHNKPLQQETHFPYIRDMQSVAQHLITLSAIVFGMNG